MSLLPRESKEGETDRHAGKLSPYPAVHTTSQTVTLPDRRSQPFVMLWKMGILQERCPSPLLESGLLRKGLMAWTPGLEGRGSAGWERRHRGLS